MNNNDSNTPDDELPVVNEACGDTTWDDVLAQPVINPLIRAPLPPFTLESLPKCSYLLINNHFVNQRHFVSSEEFCNRNVLVVYSLTGSKIIGSFSALG